MARDISPESLIVPSIASQEPKREPVKIILLGSQESVTRMIHTLHCLGFTDPNDWSPLQRAKNSGDVISLLIKRV